jgi:hypothetical protein
MIKYRIIKSTESFRKHSADGNLSNAVIKGVDISAMDVDWSKMNVRNATFVGCKLKSLAEESTLREGGARIFTPFDGLPYDPFRSTLYSSHELMDGYHELDESNNSLDRRIENHFVEHGGHDPDIVEKLAQTLHDYSIDTAIKDLLGVDQSTGMPVRKAVGIMGGHLARRDDPFYAKTARMAAMLTNAGYYVTSGGGPGIMEAANMGAYMAPHGMAAVDDAVSILAKNPEYSFPDGRLDHAYVEQAQKVVEKYPNGAESLAIPTWFYGHEPVNLFASHIGKYFSNSLREDGLLAISIYGIVYAPGSAATAQEVFADAAQNHYSTFDYISPMVFLGTSHYLLSQIYSCLAQQAAGHPYAQMITINDEPEKLLQFIQKHPPIRMRAI